MTISGGRTEQLDIFCRVTGFTSDFLSFIVVEHIRFFHGALQFIFNVTEVDTTVILSCCDTTKYITTYSTDTNQLMMRHLLTSALLRYTAR